MKIDQVKTTISRYIEALNGLEATAADVEKELAESLLPVADGDGRKFYHIYSAPEAECLFNGLRWYMMCESEEGTYHMYLKDVVPDGLWRPVVGYGSKPHWTLQFLRDSSDLLEVTGRILARREVGDKPCSN